MTTLSLSDKDADRHQADALVTGHRPGHDGKGAASCTAPRPCRAAVRRRSSRSLPPLGVTGKAAGGPAAVAGGRSARRSWSSTGTGPAGRDGTARRRGAAPGGRRRHPRPGRPRQVVSPCPPTPGPARPRSPRAHLLGAYVFTGTGAGRRRRGGRRVTVAVSRAPRQGRQGGRRPRRGARRGGGLHPRPGQHPADRPVPGRVRRAAPALGKEHGVKRRGARREGAAQGRLRRHPRRRQGSTAARGWSAVLLAGQARPRPSTSRWSARASPSTPAASRSSRPPDGDDEERHGRRRGGAATVVAAVAALGLPVRVTGWLASPRTCRPARPSARAT